MKRIVIIGGGMAGLSAGCYARMNGYEAVIFEMHTKPGGLCTSWERNGYTFDGSIHWLDGTSPEHPFHVVWRELGALKDKKVYYKDVSLKVFLKDRVISLYNDPDTLETYLRGLAPEDDRPIGELAEMLRTFYKGQTAPLFKAKELYNILDKLKEFKCSLPIIRLFQKYAKTTIDEFAGRFANPVLREVIRSVVDTRSMDDAMVKSIFGVVFLLATRGSGFPEGGSLKFAESIERRYLSLGGAIRYRAKVRQILVEDDEAVGIRLDDGTEIRSDFVISAADGHSTIFGMLEGKFLNPKIRKCYAEEALFPPIVQVSMGVDADVTGIADQNAYYNVHRLERPLIIAGKENLTLRIKNYSFDPSFAPPGKTALVAFFSSDAAYWEKTYADKEEYEEAKRSIGESVISRLEEIMPGLRGKIETIDVATPMTYIRYTGNRKASTMGFTKGFLLHLPRTLPGLKKFYMAGQWVGDTGVSGAAKSGRDIIQLICEKDGKQFETTEA